MQISRGTGCGKMLAGLIVNIEANFWVPDPNLYSMEEWASALPPAFNDIPRVVGIGEDWELWADALCSSRIGLQYGIPTPRQFDNWKDWAVRVYQVLQ